jgi:hypothetical protein
MIAIDGQRAAAQSEYARPMKGMTTHGVAGKRKNTNERSAPVMMMLASSTQSNDRPMRSTANPIRERKVRNLQVNTTTETYYQEKEKFPQT